MGEPSRAPDTTVDYHAVFQAMTAAKLVLSPELVILDANRAFLRAVGMARETVVGRTFLEAFDSSGVGRASLAVESLRRVARTGRPDMLGPHRRDFVSSTGELEERWWILTTVPVLDGGGQVTLLVTRAEDISDMMTASGRSTALQEGQWPRPGAVSRWASDALSDPDLAANPDVVIPDVVPTGEPAPAAAPDEAVVEHALVVGSTVGRFASELARERRAAMELQDSILTPPPCAPDLHIDVRYRPASPEVHVGGDWYDAFVLPSGTTVVAVGDVSGHDIRAAAVMGQLRGVLRSIGYGTAATPAEVLDSTERVAEGLGLDATATVTLACVEPAGDDGRRRVQWASAGHPPAVVRRADGTAELLLGRPDPLIGLGLRVTRKNRELRLEPGDTLLMYTDGLVERRGESLRVGLERLRRAVESCDTAADGFLDAILQELVPAGTEDDVALVAVHVETASIRSESTLAGSSSSCP